MEYINNVQGTPKPVGPYSQAVKSGSFVFCSGQVGLDPETGKLVEGGIEGETRQVLNNISLILSASGCKISDIVMTSIFLTQMSDFPVVNKIYAEFVSPEALPARQTVAVKELPLGARVEISVILEKK